MYNICETCVCVYVCVKNCSVPSITSQILHLGFTTMSYHIHMVHSHYNAAKEKRGERGRVPNEKRL